MMMPQRQSRLLREISMLFTCPQNNVSIIYPPSLESLENFFLSNEHIRIKLRGSPETPYYNGEFILKISFPNRYPFEPPYIVFETRIYHPNIDDQGKICLDLLKMPPNGTWTPSMNISTVLTSIQVLLNYPNLNDPLVMEIAQQYKFNRDVYFQRASKMTQLYAMNNAHTANNNTITISNSANAHHHSDEHSQQENSFRTNSDGNNKFVKITNSKTNNSMLMEKHYGSLTSQLLGTEFEDESSNSSTLKTSSASTPPSVISKQFSFLLKTSKKRKI